MLLPFALWLGIFVLIPLALVVYYGITAEEAAEGAHEYRIIYSLSNFSRLADGMYLRLLWRSLYIAFLTTVFCLLLGYPVSMILSVLLSSTTGSSDMPSYFLIRLCVVIR